MAPVESDYESWLLEQGGIVFEREARGLNSGDLQNLIVCLWWLDYGMRNAGDSDTVLLDAYPNALSDALRLATTLNLPIATAMLRQSRDDFERTYFDHFVPVCTELKRALELDS